MKLDNLGHLIEGLYFQHDEEYGVVMTICFGEGFAAPPCDDFPAQSWVICGSEQIEKTIETLKDRWYYTVARDTFKTVKETVGMAHSLGRVEIDQEARHIGAGLEWLNEGNEKG